MWMVGTELPTSVRYGTGIEWKSLTLSILQGVLAPPSNFRHVNVAPCTILDSSAVVLQRRTQAHVLLQNPKKTQYYVLLQNQKIQHLCSAASSIIPTQHEVSSTTTFWEITSMFIYLVWNSCECQRTWGTWSEWIFTSHGMHAFLDSHSPSVNGGLLDSQIGWNSQIMVL